MSETWSLFIAFPPYTTALFAFNPNLTRFSVKSYCLWIDLLFIIFMSFIWGQQKKNQNIKLIICFYFYNSTLDPELVTRCHSNTPNNFFEIRQRSTTNITCLLNFHLKVNAYFIAFPTHWSCNSLIVSMFWPQKKKKSAGLLEPND